MNKIITFAGVFLVSVVFSEAILAKEIQQGTVEISGELDLSFSSTEVESGGGRKTKTDAQTFDTSISYYFSPNVGLGVLWSYENSETTDGYFSTEITSTFIGPQLTFNISLDDKTSFRLKGAVFAVSTEVNISSSTAEDDGFGWAVQGGISYFVMESVSFDGGITYSSLSIEENSSNAGIDATNLSVGVGISVYIF